MRSVENRVAKPTQEQTKQMDERFQESVTLRQSERDLKAEKIYDRWKSKKSIVKVLDEAYPKVGKQAFQNSLFLINSTEKYLKQLGESVISSQFKTTPQNVVRIVTYGYPQSIREQLFYHFAMETAKDSMFFLHATREAGMRGAGAGSRIVESTDYRYGTDMDYVALNESTGTYTASLTNVPLVPHSLKVIVGATGAETYVGSDDGNGAITGTGISNGTIDYATGAISLNYAGGATIHVEVAYDTEAAANYDQLGNVNLSIEDVQFRLRNFPLGVSWSKLAALTLSTTLGIDAEAELIRGAGDELRKALDFQAIELLARVGRSNGATIGLDLSTLEGGETRMSAANRLSAQRSKGKNRIFNDLLRGTVNNVVGGSNYIETALQHPQFQAASGVDEIGAHLVGTIPGLNIYQAPDVLLGGADKAFGLYKNQNSPSDAALAFGTLLPLYVTDKLEFKNQQTEMGMGYYGDHKVIQPKYCVPFSVTLPA